MSNTIQTGSLIIRITPGPREFELLAKLAQCPWISIASAGDRLGEAHQCIRIQTTDEQVDLAGRGVTLPNGYDVVRLDAAAPESSASDGVVPVVKLPYEPQLSKWTGPRSSPPKLFLVVSCDQFDAISQEDPITRSLEVYSVDALFVDGCSWSLVIRCGAMPEFLEIVTDRDAVKQIIASAAELIAL